MYVCLCSIERRASDAGDEVEMITLMTQQQKKIIQHFLKHFTSPAHVTHSRNET